MPPTAWSCKNFAGHTAPVVGLALTAEWREPDFGGRRKIDSHLERGRRGPGPDDRSPGRLRRSGSEPRRRPTGGRAGRRHDEGLSAGRRQGSGHARRWSGPVARVLGRRGPVGRRRRQAAGRLGPDDRHAPGIVPRRGRLRDAGRHRRSRAGRGRQEASAANAARRTGPGRPAEEDHPPGVQAGRDRAVRRLRRRHAPVV